MFLLWMLVAHATSGPVESAPAWDTLRVTWGLNPLSSNVFAKMPMTESKAKSDGFHELSGSCSDGQFLGHRYMKGQDTAAILLYDVNGYIAGIQFGVPKGDILNVTMESYENIPAFQLDTISGKEIYLVTAYFVDPKIICNGGRTKEQFQAGTGTGLYLQNGSNPIQDSKEVPMYEKDIKETLWVKGQCFRSMGVHYWYKAHEDMDCNTLFPFTVIYNRGKLTTFAFFAPGYYKYSKRLEHPPRLSLSSFLPTPLPKCVIEEYKKSGGYTTMHVYFNVKPWNLLC